MKKPTMQDIADRVGLTRQAVSVILNRKTTGNGRTRPHGDATREKVLAVARELNYQPNYFAQSLKRGRTRCIGIMGSAGRTLGFHATLFTRMASAVEYRLEALRSSYSLITFGANFHETSYERSIELVSKGMTDGLLIFMLARDIPVFEENLQPVLETNNIPFVVVHTLSRELPYHNVGRDTFLAGRIAGRHMAAAGHTAFGYLRPETFEHTADWGEHYQGFLRGLEENGRSEADVRPILYEDRQKNRRRGDRFTVAYDAVTALTDVPPCITTILDEMAYGVEKALNEKGLRVPEDVALFAGEDDKAPAYVEPHFTAVTNPLEEMGRAGLDMLLGLLDGTLDRDVVQRKIVKPELIVRETA